MDQTNNDPCHSERPAYIPAEDQRLMLQVSRDQVQLLSLGLGLLVAMQVGELVAQFQVTTVVGAFLRERQRFQRANPTGTIPGNAWLIGDLNNKLNQALSSVPHFCCGEVHDAGIELRNLADA